MTLVFAFKALDQAKAAAEKWQGAWVRIVEKDDNNPHEIWVCLKGAPHDPGTMCSEMTKGGGVLSYYWDKYPF